MQTYYHYHFHIIDRELGYTIEYDFDCYFEDHMEADRFITENEHAGNTVIMIAPFITEVQMNPEDLPR
jgi:hypothetical protein